MKRIPGGPPDGRWAMITTSPVPSYRMDPAPGREALRPVYRGPGLLISPLVRLHQV